MQEVCYGVLCFVPPDNSTVPRIFGFAEFISALALLVITYTLVDVRYRFRLAIAPTPLFQRTFAVIGLVGIQTLVTEVWLAQGWWLPKTVYLTRVIWQGYFGLLFLVTFMTWVWYAYIRPPVYGRHNYRRYAQELYRLVVRGNDGELAVIADELRRSAKSLVSFAPTASRWNQLKGDDLPAAEGYAHDVLQLIANRKLCRYVVATAPTTAIVFFEEAVRAQKYELPLGTFAKNVATEAVANLDSPLYHELDVFSSGLLGHLRPFRQAVWGHYALVEGLGANFESPLDVSYQERDEWTAHQWKAYCRATVTTLAAYVREPLGRHMHPSTLFRAADAIESSFNDFYKLQDITADYYSTDTCRRLCTAVKFVEDAVDVLDKHEASPLPHTLRRRKEDYGQDIYDALADLMFELVFAASSITGPPEKAWSVHHNMVWSQFFGLGKKSRNWRVLQFKLRRLLYNEIAEIETMPNYKNARILGICLNVTGLKVRSGNYGRDYRALARAIFPIAQRCYATLRQRMPRVAEAVLIGGITYDVERNSLVKTYLQGLNEQSSREYLQLADAEDMDHRTGRGSESQK
ncbi:hypothetical protein [Ralstonia wenshanensis]|uniref:hypothetical protein n=1 Tax=Ralstonia wenshanensis TaxID=2842456 RepID=UPI003D98781C